MSEENQKKQPAQTQELPGQESKMVPSPEAFEQDYQGSQKLVNKTAIITGGDSGIGRAVAIAFAKEGADVVIAYLNEHEDAAQTKKWVETTGQRCLTMAGDLKSSHFCQEIIKKTITTFKKVDILVNNAAEQHEQEDFTLITDEQLESTFRTNVFSMFYMIRAALPYMEKDSCIINSTSVTAYKGSHHLMDYAASKGAIVSLTRSLAKNLIQKGIRVNAVAPGPVWTPLIPASLPAEKVEKFGSQAPMQRAAQPKEIAPCYVFLASKDSQYMSGQVLHPNGGVVLNT